MATAGGVALGAALPLPGSAASAGEGPDPILAAIEAHKAAHAKWLSWLHRRSELESDLPKERRHSNIDAWGEKIVETDDPKWIEAERECDLTGDAETDAAWAILDELPTTKAGVLALIGHTIAHDPDGCAWPEGWHDALLEALSETIHERWQERAV